MKRENNFDKYKWPIAQPNKIDFGATEIINSLLL